jgi:tetratricopeptide (TPR) repeat protein
LLGDTLRPLSLAPEARQRHEERLAQARADVARSPGNVDAMIWLGRRTAYLGNYRDAIEIFTRAIAQTPDDARLYRHRGHRYITVRELDRALGDFERAAELTAGKLDEIEPDGLPNARNIPTSTLQSNIWYHLALTHYLQGNFPRALEAYRQCMALSTNDDMRVATAHWLYMTLRRMGRDEEAAAVLTPITREMDIIENGSYHQLLLMYKGEVAPEALLSPAKGEDAALSDATVTYGVANWHLYNGRRAEAEALFRHVIAGGQWPSFGYIAAEAELRRLAER